MRAALYIRVSTAEQAMHGYSLAAQEELLRQYASEHGHTVVGVYADEGKSASHNLDRRKALLRMVEDAEAGKVQTILFKDITRWSRKASDYYKIQDRLDKCGCSWTAVQQPYLETLTPTGRFQVSVMLGTAQLEAEQTSERIKFTSASRIPKGGVLYGSAQCPLGYKIGTKDGIKRMVIDESTRCAAEAMFAYFLQSGNVQRTVKMLIEQYGIRKYENSVRTALRNPIYIGEYKGIAGYTDPLISVEQFDACRKLLERRSYTAPRNPGKYFLSSLIVCSECGNKMTGHYNRRPNGTNLVYYRCKQRATFGTCKNSACVNQEATERFLLENIATELDKYIITAKTTQQSDSSEKERDVIRRKLTRLDDLYINGDMDRADYDRRKAALYDQLGSIPEVGTSNLSTIQSIIDSGWRSMYDSLPGEKKAVFWRSVIKQITAHPDKSLDIVF